MYCYICAGGFHYECLSPTEDNTCCCTIDTAEVVTIEPSNKQRGGQVKDATEMIDPESTGRKRAVQIKPITPGLTCEWSMLKFAGGGVVPIVGCMGNDAKHVHHGPDKNTTNNNDENLHRVCNSCHNRWHSLNDIYYGERPNAGTPFVPRIGNNQPHDPNTTATASEVFDHEVWWSSNKNIRGPHVNQPEVTNVGSADHASTDHASTE